MRVPAAFYCAKGHAREQVLSTFEVDAVTTCLDETCDEPVHGPFPSVADAERVRDLRAAQSPTQEPAHV